MTTRRKSERPSMMAAPYTPSPKLMQAHTAAFQACHRLIFTYQQGRRPGASINWSQMDAAHETAIEALRLQRESAK